MSDTDQKKSVGKQERARKPEQRSRKADKRAAKAAQSEVSKVAPQPVALTEAALSVAAAPIEQIPIAEPVPASLPEVSEQVATPLAPAAIEADEVAAAPERVPPAAPAKSRSTALAVVETAAPVSIFSLAQAYGDYTRKSYEQTRSFFDKLTGVRSFDKAVEVQAEYAKAALEAFVSQTEKIGEIHRELAMQRFRRFEGLMTGTTQPTR